MAITSGLCNDFFRLLLKAGHNFTNSGGTNTSTFRFVFIRNTHTGTYGAQCTSAGTPGTGSPTGSPTGTTSIGTDAAGATGDYTPVTGMTLVFDEPAMFDTTKAVTHPAAPIVLANTNFNSGGAGTIRGMQIFNSSNSGASVMNIDFGAEVSTTNDTLTITWPTKNGTTGLIRLNSN